MRVLITGAAGNLGSKLRFALAGRYELILLDRSPKGDSAIHAFDLSCWDEAWVERFEGVNTVIHLAGNPDERATWTELIRDNLDAVLNVYEACLRHGARRLIFASSNHVLGAYAGEEGPPLRGDTPPSPMNAYGATKLMGERIGRSYSGRHGISSINVRIGWNLRSINNRPGANVGDWGRKMWLSDRDFIRLMEACITATAALRWAIVNGVSDNHGMRWDLAEARQLVGYEPVDDAFAPQSE